MGLRRLDHVNLRTADLAAMAAFYGKVLGLETGPRPPFRFPGAWLYLEGEAVVHLVEVAKRPAGESLRLEHFAFAAEGLADFLEHLRARKVAYRIGLVPGRELVQVNLHDPDGNHIHVDFGPEGGADLSDYDGR